MADYRYELRLLHGHVVGLKGKPRFTALALPLVLIVTASYHWGYPQYREDGLSRPETGNVLISIPMFATVNPVGQWSPERQRHDGLTRIDVRRYIECRRYVGRDDRVLCAAGGGGSLG